MLNKIKNKITKSRIFRNKNQHDKIILFIPVLYIIFVSIYMVYHRAWFSPDQFFAFAILSVILIGRTRQFLWDWIPVLVLIFGYEYLRGIIPELTKNAHFMPLIWADHLIFGYVPAIKLQSLLYHADRLRWYDYVSVTLYISHFIIPMIVAFIFWLNDRKHFKRYTSAFIILSYLAFFTFIIFPAAPPWLASMDGYLPPMNKIMDQVLASFGHPITVPTIYQFFGANLVAAFPSLHAAYPWLIFLFIRKKSKKIGYLSLFYVFGVWFSVMYLGEHYFIDVVAGMVYSTVAYILVMQFTKIKDTTPVLTPDPEITSEQLAEQPNSI